MGGFDHASVSEAVSRPGIDPRLWVSYGTVNEDTPDARSTRFVDDNGDSLPTGPLVTVTLQPSGQTVVCRVASFIAGIGEGSWMPFVEKDEVIVIIPHGDLKSGPVIIGRLNQAIDTFPGIVAGQDATKNTFGFWRLRVPFVIETGESFLIRSAKTGAQIGIDPTGQIIFNNGDKHHIIIASDAIAFSSGDEKTFLQLNFTEGRATIAVDGGRFELSKTGESQLFAPGVLNLGAGGARGSGHAVTVEQLIAWTANLVCQLALTGAFTSTIPNPYTSAAWPAGAPAALNALFAAMIPAQTSSVPIGTAGTPGGDTTLIAPALSLLNVALAVPPDQTGFIPGLGRGSLML